MLFDVCGVLPGNMPVTQNLIVSLAILEDTWLGMRVTPPHVWTAQWDGVRLHMLRLRAIPACQAGIKVKADKQAALTVLFNFSLMSLDPCLAQDARLENAPMTQE